MIRELKEILIKIAALPRSDQRWIISKLPDQQTAIFKQMQGEQQLEKARRFRCLNTKHALTKLTPPLASTYPQALANYPPLYIAIVLEQGKFPWQESFLQAVDQDDTVKFLLYNRVQELKDAARQALFKQWEANSSLQSFLEQNHG